LVVNSAPARYATRAVRRFAPLLLAALLAGCMIGPDYKAPPTQIAERWKETGSAVLDTAPQDSRQWWQLFNDPVLNDLIALAYRENLDLRMAGLRVIQSRAQLGIAIGEFYPQQQGVNGEVTYNRIPGSIPYNVIKNTYWQSLLGAQAGWEIDLWGKIRRAILGADSAYLASVASYDDVLVTLTADVASTYVQIRTLEKRLAIALANIDRQREALRIANARYHGGVVTKRDVYQAENVLGATQASIPELTIELQKSRDALSVLVGMPPGGIDDLIGNSPEIPVAPPQVAVGIPADLMRRRPDLRQAELEAAAQCAEIGVAKADLLPSLMLVGTVGTVSSNIGRNSLSDLFTGKSLTYQVGPTVQWNLLNYGQITNNVRVQDARFQELLVGYQNAVLQAQQDMQNALTVYVQSQQQVSFLEQSTEAARGALRIGMNEYKEGTADFTVVLTAEQNLFQAQDNLAVAQSNVPLGLIAAYRAMGGGWEIREGHDFIPAATRDEMAGRTDWGTVLTPELLTPQAPGLPAPDDASGAPRAPEW
jgi:NodT family efflux transporter outer membrane factor (OMF) lipoprotein